MVECQNNVDGVCAVASYLAKHRVKAMAHEDTCNRCITLENPRAFNKATCGLAVLYLYKAGLFDKDRDARLIECGATVVSATGSLENRPGAALTLILEKIGVRQTEDCYCEHYAAQMDVWGWAGCKARRQEIIDHLNAQSVSWFDMLKVAAAGYFTTGQLVDHALELSDPANFAKVEM